MKLLLYCTNAKKQKDLLWSNNLKHFFLDGAYNRLIDNLPEYLLNGKIVAECDFEVEEITNCGTSFMIMKYDDLQESYNYTNKIARDSCLNYNDLKRYLGTNNGYAIHIKNLHIFDTPKELDDFTTRTPVDYDSIICDSCTNFNSDCKKCRYSYDYQQVIKAPQNMMKVYNRAGECHILISIKSQWMCLILNRIKDVEVRKVVLKEMLGK